MGRAMMRIVSLHGRPSDPAEFDRYYRDVHTPLVQRIPGVRNIRFGRVLGTNDAAPPPYRTSRAAASRSCSASTRTSRPSSRAVADVEATPVKSANRALDIFELL